MTYRLNSAAFSSGIIVEKNCIEQQTLLVSVFLMQVKQQNEAQRAGYLA